jgi:hypothetical protein
MNARRQLQAKKIWFNKKKYKSKSTELWEILLHDMNLSDLAVLPVSAAAAA